MAEKKSGPNKAVVNQYLSQLGFFSKDTSGPLGMEERLNIASYNVHIFKEIIKELIKE
jgi:hypothetical protein